MRWTDFGVHGRKYNFCVTGFGRNRVGFLCDTHSVDVRLGLRT